MQSEDAAAALCCNQPGCPTRFDILKDHRAQVQAAGQAAEFPPGSAAGGSLTEQRNMARVKVAKCQQLGGWLRGKDGCARCDQPRNAHTP